MCPLQPTTGMFTVKILSAAQVCCCSSHRGGFILSLLLNGHKNMPIISRTVGCVVLDTHWTGSRQESWADCKETSKHQPCEDAAEPPRRWIMPGGQTVRGGPASEARCPLGTAGLPGIEAQLPIISTLGGRCLRNNQAHERSMHCRPRKWQPTRQRLRGPDAVARHRLQNKYADCAQRNGRQD